MTDYAALDDEAQAKALRPVALAAAAAFGIEVASMRLALHAYNTTFRIDAADGRRIGLRVLTNSSSTEQQVRGQQAWQVAIAEQTDLTVPTPLETRDGDSLALIDAEPLGRQVIVSASTWMSGPELDDLTPEIARPLGAAMATLHAQATDWAPPAGTAMRPLDEPLLGDEPRLLDREELDADDRALLQRALEAAAVANARAAETATPRAIHADLHGGNLKWQDGRLAIFDFDDAGIGSPALDLAISTFYIRDLDAQVEEALRAGYAEVAPLPGIDPADLEALVAGRQLLLANSLLTSTTADLRAMVPGYLAKTVDRLRRWEATGRLTLLPG